MPPPPKTFGGGGILYPVGMCPSMSESVCPENLVNTIPQKPMKGISPNFDHRCIWVNVYADYIVGSKGQRSMTLKTG